MAQYAPAKFTRVINLDEYNNQEIQQAVLPRTKDKTYKVFLEFFASNINGHINKWPLPETIDNFYQDFETALSWERDFIALILLYCFSSARTGEVNNMILDAKTMVACYKHFTLTVKLVNNIPMLVLTYTREFVKGDLPIKIRFQKELADTPVFRTTAKLDYKISTCKARNANIFGKEFAMLGHWYRKYSQEARIKQAAHRDPWIFGRSYAYLVYKVNRPATFLNITSQYEYIQNYYSINVHCNPGLL
ncbi:uncharacterized protein BJX67DRAFT_369728 [Aspergillus lucknowensis]|uniref:Uncharacterized protein n=1 Tax=Aspergillus lucknowensis TaxID=176173 RepID=A0ABR4M4X1_9EURO